MTKAPTFDAPERIHYLDAVRALAMLLGVFFHAGLAYAASIQGLWPVGDMKASSVALDVFVWFSHLFRMTLFFLVAGFFAKLLVERRGIAGFLKNRALRVGLPFVVFWPAVTGTVLFLVLWAIDTMPELPPILQLVSESIEGGADPPVPTTGHLWFLYYLLYFCAIGSILARFGGPWATQLADAFFRSPRNLLWAPLLLVPALASTLVPVPAPETFSPQLFPFGYYGLFFLMGWHLLHRPHYLDLVEKHLGLLVATSVVGYALYFLRLPIEPVSLEMLRTFADGPPLPTGWGHLVNVTIEAYLSVYLTLITLLLGRRFLSSPNRVLRYVSDASYWIYLVHLPLVLSAQVLLSRLDIGVWPKFAGASLGTIAVALVGYELGVRYTPIGTMLNGKRRRAASRRSARFDTARGRGGVR